MGITDLAKMSTYTTLSKAYMILIFYCLVLFVTSTIGYTLNKNNGFTYGMIIGMIISLYLWFNYGKSMSYV